MPFEHSRKETLLDSSKGKLATVFMRPLVMWSVATCNGHFITVHFGKWNVPYVFYKRKYMDLNNVAFYTNRFLKRFSDSNSAMLFAIFFKLSKHYSLVFSSVAINGWHWQFNYFFILFFLTARILDKMPVAFDVLPPVTARGHCCAGWKVIS